MRKFNFYTPTQYNPVAKDRFHAVVKSRFRLLARNYVSNSPPAIYSNYGGPSVSGEIYFKTAFYTIEASQPLSVFDAGLRIYRSHPHEGPNNFAPLSLLNDPSLLQDKIDKWMNFKPNIFATAPVQLPLLPHIRRAA